MWQTIAGRDLSKDWRFHVHAERFEIADLVGKDDEELARWLEDRWLKKSAILLGLNEDLQQGLAWGQGAGKKNL
jgi:hypothetical protein